MFDRTNIHWPLEVVARFAVDVDSTDLERLIGELTADHAQFMAILDQDSPVVLIGGCDERLLERNVGLLRRRVPCELHLDPPQVGYRETISKAVEVDYSHENPTGDAGQFARVRILIEPLEDGYGFQFENRTAAGAVPKKYIVGVEEGIQSLVDTGVLAGFPMVGLKVSLVDGAYRDVDSSVLAFELASRAAFLEAIRKADPVLLEPVIKVEVATPEEYFGELIADLNGRRGSMSGMKPGEDDLTTVALVPAGQIFGFPNALAHLTRDRGSFSAQFSHYEKARSVPGDDPPWPEPGSAALRA